MKNSIRIIGGKWRSRKISFIDTPKLRPTPTRVRETLFNWLQFDVAGSHCLDLFAGSGALGFEAASRGAKLVVQVEHDDGVCRKLKENARLLSAVQVKLFNQDVFRFLSSEAQAYNLVFMDPPFTGNMVANTCQWLEEKGWLADQAIIYIESEIKFGLSVLPENWREIKNKTAGEVAYHLYQRENLP